MALFKATLELLVDVDCETEASDCIAETLREQLRKFSPGSRLIDWRYAGVDGEPVPHDGRGFEYSCRPPQE
ncbi:MULTISPECIES: hypothetical protein [Rhizobium/Agrobacterium group]|uniref:Uncharacterized protein n=2 Tax=Agrobacterium tumefaciens complex TaxID=1183400 RepID=A0AAE6END2_AGRTU|nr:MULTISPECIES: hypothetical protein [Rhizobium/Agrobacterium group]MCA2379793.1 hypothetical protein [Agrobacterium tomkonis RTP8]PZU18487.1 MAG: hypothetical protein DI589_24560 [Shinella sp.]CUX65917.1 hypothetical protein AGR5A_pa30058 [Agrobacterium genomosp. 5 str. CFBP 6626]KRA64104.1 hypothetical protein ASD85_26375 [Rhizobium sp. Root651]MCA2371134.1 hypothetical protein [Agrobacterium tomkonis CIP 111-78]